MRKLLILILLVSFGFIGFAQWPYNLPSSLSKITYNDLSTKVKKHLQQRNIYTDGLIPTNQMYNMYFSSDNKNLISIKEASVEFLKMNNFKKHHVVMLSKIVLKEGTNNNFRLFCYENNISKGMLVNHFKDTAYIVDYLNTGDNPNMTSYYSSMFARSLEVSGPLYQYYLYITEENLPPGFTPLDSNKDYSEFSDCVSQHFISLSTIKDVGALYFFDVVKEDTCLLSRWTSLYQYKNNTVCSLLADTYLFKDSISVDEYKERYALNTAYYICSYAISKNGRALVIVRHGFDDYSIANELKLWFNKHNIYSEEMIPGPIY